MPFSCLPWLLPDPCHLLRNTRGAKGPCSIPMILCWYVCLFSLSFRLYTVVREHQICSNWVHGGCTHFYTSKKQAAVCPKNACAPSVRTCTVMTLHHREETHWPGTRCSCASQKQGMLETRVYFRDLVKMGAISQITQEWSNEG